MKRMIRSSVQTTVNSASYGGAYDIADDQYFTREDLVDLAEYVIESLSKTFQVKFEIEDLFIDGGDVYIELYTDAGFGLSFSKALHIDMRKIREPRDLITKYGPQFIKFFKPDIEKTLKEVS